MNKACLLASRTCLANIGKTAAAGAALLSMPVYAQGSAGHVVVVGGGFGGATAARYVKRRNPDVRVTLIEPATTYLTCPFMNLHFGGLRTFDQQAHTFDDLRSAEIGRAHV